MLSIAIDHGYDPGSAHGAPYRVIEDPLPKHSVTDRIAEEILHVSPSVWHSSSTINQPGPGPARIEEPTRAAMIL